MIKCKIHIANECEYMHADVSVTCFFPCLPQIGTVIHLTDDLEGELERKARLSNEIADNYLPKWFYGKSVGCENIEEANLNDLGFGDAIYVKNIRFIPNTDYVDIELDQ